MREGIQIMSLLNELRLSFRRFLRAPVFTAVSLLTVGVGIGSFTSVFGLADAVLLERMPYDRPNDLVWVWRDYTWAHFPRGWLAGTDIVGLRGQGEVFEGVVALRSGPLNLTGPTLEAPRQIRSISTSHELFDLLGVRPFLGRGFNPGEDVAGASLIAVLDHAFWRAQFGGDPGVVGRTIMLDGEAARVVGVMPSSFRFVKHASGSPPVGADVYVNMRFDLADSSPSSPW